MIYTTLHRQYINPKKRTNNDLHNTTQTIYWPKEKDKQWSTQHYTENILTKRKGQTMICTALRRQYIDQRKGQTMIYTTLHRQYIDQKKRTNNDLHSTTQTIYWPKEKDKQWSTQHYTDNILTKRKGQTMIYTVQRRQYIDQKKRTNNDLHNITQTIYWPKEKDKQWSTQRYADNILTKRKGQTMIYKTLHRQYIDKKKRTNNALHNTTQTIYWPKEKDKQ